MALLDSLLDAIIRLSGDALVMHVGEKPYVVTTSSVMNALRGPLAWGQVELSSRPLTPDALLGMLAQILPDEQRQMLDYLGAVEHELPAPDGGQPFLLTAARGGDDIWVEVRRKPHVEELVVSPAESEVQPSEQPASEPAIAEPPEAIPEPEPLPAVAEAPATVSISAGCDIPEPVVEEAVAAILHDEIAEPQAQTAADLPSEPSVEVVTQDSDVVVSAADLQMEMAAQDDEELHIDLTAALAEEDGDHPEIFEADAILAPHQEDPPIAAPEPLPPIGIEDVAAESLTPAEPLPAAIHVPEPTVAGQQPEPVQPVAGPPPVVVEHLPTPPEPAQPVAAAPLLPPIAVEQVAPPQPAAAVPEPTETAAARPEPMTVVAVSEPSVAVLPPEELVPPVAEPQQPVAVAAEPQPPVAVAAEPQPPVAVAAEPPQAPVVAAVPEPPPAVVEQVAPQPAQAVTAASAPPLAQIAVAPEPPQAALSDVTPAPVTEPAPTVVPIAKPSLKLQPPPAPAVSVPAASTEASLVALLKAAASRGASTLYAVADARPMIRVAGAIALLGTEAPVSGAEVDRFTFEFAPREHVAERTPEWTCAVNGVGRVRCVTFHDDSGTGLIFHLPSPDVSTADELGLDARIQALCEEADGLVVIAAPRNNGKSTLLDAFVDLINRTRYDHVITIESQIRTAHEKRHSFISQRLSNPDGEAIAAAARSALREGPDVLVIEDLRAPEALSVALDAARAGRLVFGGIAAPTAAVAVERLVGPFPADRRPQVRALLATSLRAVVAQVLVRKPAGGRIGARELLLNSPAVEKLILDGSFSQLPLAIEGGRRLGMVTMNDALGALVRDGVVTVAEAVRAAADRASLVAALERDGIDVSGVERRA